MDEWHSLMNEKANEWHVDFCRQCSVGNSSIFGTLLGRAGGVISVADKNALSDNTLEAMKSDGSTSPLI